MAARNTCAVDDATNSSDDIKLAADRDGAREAYRPGGSKASVSIKSDGSVDLMKSFSLGGFEGVGGSWKLPPSDDTFDARSGRW